MEFESLNILVDKGDSLKSPWKSIATSTDISDLVVGELQVHVEGN